MKTSAYRFRGNIAPRAGIRASILDPTLDGQTATLDLYDPIDSWGGEWGVSAKEVKAALAGLPDNVSEIRLHINSPGGEVWDALAITNTLRQHPARVVAVVDGLAASAASFIAASADETLVAPNAQLMIHDAWGLCAGPAADMRDMAKRLDQVSDNLAEIYAARGATDVQAWRDLMLAETWFTAQEAVDAGLADAVLDSAPTDARAAQNRFDLSIFTHAGRAKAPAPSIPLPGAGVEPPPPFRQVTRARLNLARPGR